VIEFVCLHTLTVSSFHYHSYEKLICMCTDKLDSVFETVRVCLCGCGYLCVTVCVYVCVTVCVCV